MPSSSFWGLTPRQSIDQECARRGRDAVVAGCVRLILLGDADPGLVLALGGPGAQKFLDGTPRVDTYWLRVWGARGLLWVWDDTAVSAVKVGLTDDAWRVREMAAKVVARHLVGDALPEVSALRDDPVARVRAAGRRAVAMVTERGA